MRRTAEFIASLALFVLLSTGGTALVSRFALPLPGPVLGLLIYILMLSLGFLGWTTAAARWLSGLLGAMIVPAFVGIAVFATTIIAGGWRLAVALVAGTLITGIVTAIAFRAAGGRA